MYLFLGAKCNVSGNWKTCDTLTVSKTEEWTGRRDIELRVHVLVWDIQTAVKWACKGSMQMGHVDVCIHPPHTIRNSIQLQAALAIPQVCSLSCKLTRTWGFLGGLDERCLLSGRGLRVTPRALHMLQFARVWFILFLIYHPTDFLIVPLFMCRFYRSLWKTHYKNLPVLLYQQLHFEQLWFVKFAHTDFQPFSGWETW